MPVVVAVASTVGVIWGCATMLVFAPAGLLLGVTVIDAPSSVVALGGVAVLAVSFHGFAIGGRLCAVGGKLADPTEGAVSRARRVARCSLAHHGAVVVAIAIVSAHADAEGMFWATAGLCAIGAGLAWITWRACDVVDRIDAEQESSG